MRMTLLLKDGSGYFYRLDGKNNELTELCGNGVAGEAVVELHQAFGPSNGWDLYGLSFRFDLMGILDVQALNE